MAILELRHGALRATLAPGLGGALLSLRFGDIDLLRPAPAGSTDVLQAACFPLVPFANRIAEGRFTWGGRTGDLPLSREDQRHPLHGEGWCGVWTIDATDESSAMLAFSPQTSAWPWRYRAAQHVHLSPGGLSLTLSVTNLDDAPGPFGLGFHPYFPDSATARMTTGVSGLWETSDDLLPTHEVQAPAWANRPVRSGAPLDHCHTGWSREAAIDLGPGKPMLRLSASKSLRWLHVYAPPSEAYFCVEPVSHAPNALNMAAPENNGVWSLGPNQTAVAWMRLDLA
ncbi:aldose 1-epimerase [Phenylobacterium sp.]|uniref:aldose 1-epimerase n=1 Tax=Phenylobacterium sp. TaxID=1871053 RepID=UPI003BA8C9BA